LPPNPSAPATDPQLRTVILGIGNETGGDDAAGLAVVRALLPHLAGRDDVLVLDGGAAPENFTGPVRRFRPDLVILVDAAQMDAAPGAVRWLDWTETEGLSASTHTLPPHMLARYLVTETDCALGVIGIQPAGNTLGAPLSPAVEAAVAEVVTTLAAALSRSGA
jgi:hydrogenase 3 maturation protease